MINNIYEEFGGHVYQQTWYSTNCAPLVADLFVYSYEDDFVQHQQKSKFKKQKKSFNLNLRYIDDILSLNNPKFNDYIDVIYLNELEIKDTKDAQKWANYLDLHLELMRMVNFSHDSMTSVMTLISILSIIHI